MTNNPNLPDLSQAFQLPSSPMTDQQFAVIVSVLKQKDKLYDWHNRRVKTGGISADVLAQEKQQIDDTIARAQSIYDNWHDLHPNVR